MMRFLPLLLCCTNLSWGQVPKEFHQSVHDACLSRDHLKLASSKSDFVKTSRFFMLDFKNALERSDAAERKMRISFRETKKDPDLVPAILRETAGENKLWYLNPTQILAAMLVVQRDHPESVKEVCARYEAAIAGLRHSPDDGAETEIFQTLNQETYPCILYVDREIMWEEMTIPEFLKKLRMPVTPEKAPEK